MKPCFQPMRCTRGLHGIAELTRTERFLRSSAEPPLRWAVQSAPQETALYSLTEKHPLLSFNAEPAHSK